MSRCCLEGGVKLQPISELVKLLEDAGYRENPDMCLWEKSNKRSVTYAELEMANQGEIVEFCIENGGAMPKYRDYPEYETIEIFFEYV